MKGNWIPTIIKTTLQNYFIIQLKIEYLIYNCALRKGKKETRGTS